LLQQTCEDIAEDKPELTRRLKKSRKNWERRVAKPFTGFSWEEKKTLKDLEIGRLKGRCLKTFENEFIVRGRFCG